MPLNSSLTSRIATYAVGAGIICAAAAGLVVAKPERLLSDSFGRALDTAPAATKLSWSAQDAPGTAKFALAVNRPQIADGGYQLRRAFGAEQKLLPSQVIVGNRITFSSANGTPLVLKVIGLGGAGGGIADGETSRLLLVVTSPGRNNSGADPVRFLIEGGVPAATVPEARPDQTL